MHDNTTLSAPCNNSQDFKSQFSQESKTSFHASGSIGENLHKIGKKPAIMLRVPEDTEGKMLLEIFKKRKICENSRQIHIKTILF